MDEMQGIIGFISYKDTSCYKNDFLKRVLLTTGCIVVSLSAYCRYIIVFIDAIAFCLLVWNMKIAFKRVKEDVCLYEGAQVVPFLFGITAISLSVGLKTDVNNLMALVFSFGSIVFTAIVTIIKIRIGIKKELYCKKSVLPSDFQATLFIFALGAGLIVMRNIDVNVIIGYLSFVALQVILTSNAVESFMKHYYVKKYNLLDCVILDYVT